MFQRVPVRRRLKPGRKALLILIGMMAVATAGETAALTPMRAVEPPPPQYAHGPTEWGHTVERDLPSPEAVQAVCNFYLGRPARGYYQACYIPALDLVVLPDRKAWPSQAERLELRAHEWAHARGWRHPAMQTASVY